MPVPIRTPRRSGSIPLSASARLGRRLLGGDHGEVRHAVRAARLLRRHGDLGVELGARPDAVLDPGAPLQEGVEERVGALADRA